MVSKRDYALEAEQCRRRARAYVGRPERPFLLRVAEEFEKLALDGPDAFSNPPPKR